MFGIEVVSYLFLGGLGGGLCLVAGMAGLSIPRFFFGREMLQMYRVLMGTLFSTSTITLILAGLMLLADAGINPSLTYLFLAPKLNYLSVGAWLILIGIVLCLVIAFCWMTGRKLHNAVAMKVLFTLCALVGFGIALYTGLFLASMKAVPLWNTIWLPALFVTSSLSCGVVTFVALAKLSNVATSFPSFMRTLIQADLVVIAIEFLCAVGLVWASVSIVAEGSSASAGTISVLSLLTGKNAWVWWGGFLFIGLFATAAFDVLMLRAQAGWPGRLWSVLGTLFCVFAGAFALRYCMITAGAHPALAF